MRGALDDLGSARSGVDSVALSVAPKEDTARHVRAFLRLQDAGFLHYLTGPPAGLRRAWKRYGVHPLTQGEDHTAFVFVIDRRGIIRVGYPSHEMTAGSSCSAVVPTNSPSSPTACWIACNA